MKALAKQSQADLPLEASGQALINKTDRVFRAGSDSVSSEPHIRLLVEQLVSEACIALALQRASGNAEEKSDPPVDTQGRNHEEIYDGIIGKVRDAFALGHARSLARSIEAMSLSEDDPVLAVMLREAFEMACSTPSIALDLRKELIACTGAMAYGLHISDEVASGMEWGDTNDPDITPMPHGQVFAIPVQVEPITDEDDADLEDLVVKQEGFGELSRLIAASIAADVGVPVLGAYILPRFLTHEEIAEVGMSDLYDLPERVLRRCRMNPDDLAAGSELVRLLNAGDEHRLADIPLLAQRRVLYLIGVAWSDDPWLINASRHLWRNGLEETEREQMESEITMACEGHSHAFQVAGADLFFYGVRSGVRYQRGHIFIDALEDLLDRCQVSPSDCFYEMVVTRLHGIPPCPSLRVYSAWMTEIGEVPWPLLTFESMDEQVEEIHRLAHHMEMRRKSEVTFVSAEGTA